MYFALILAASAVFPLWIIKKGIELKNAPYQVVLVGLIYSVGGALLMFGGASIMGVDMSGSESIKTIVNSAVSNSDYISQLGLSDLSKKEQISRLTEYYQGVYMLIPTFFFVWGAVISYLEYRFISKVKIKKGFDAKPMVPIEEFSMPRNAGLSWLLLYLAASLMLSSDFEYAQIIYSNVFAVMQYALAYQGISFLCHFFKMKKLPKALCILLCVLVLFISSGIYILFLLGFTDLCFGLKGRVKEK